MKDTKFKNEFHQGFAHEMVLDQDAAKAWSVWKAFASRYSPDEVRFIESRGYDEGRFQGRKFATANPQEARRLVIFGCRREKV